MFDPYDQWLGISKDQRPLNYYHLLGIPPGETDPEVITEAAEEQAAKVSDHQDGPYAQAAARLLKEIAQAKAILLNPAKRKEYKARLRQIAAPKDQEEEQEEEAGAAPEEPSPEPAKKKKKKKSGKASRESEKTSEKKRPWLWPVLGGAAALLVLGGAAAFWLVGHKKAEVPAPAEPVVMAVPTKPEVPPPATEKEKPPPVATAPAPPPPPPPVIPAPPVPMSKPPEPPPVVKVERIPVPDEAAQARAEKEIKETYKEDYAKTKPEEQLALAAKFLQPGRENRKDPAAWFVLLREARELAVRGNGPRLAVEAVNAINEGFLIDPVEMKVKALTAIGQSAADLGAASVAQTALGLVSQAVDDDNYEAARRLVDIADGLVHKMKSNKKEADVVEARKAEVEGFAKDYQAVTQARATLKQTPDDAAANLTVGKYLCFFHGHWDEGLPFLAKGSEAALKTLAQKDLDQPADVDGQMAVADGWWRTGQDQAGRAQLNLMQRGRFWYERAGPKAEGVYKVRVVQSIQDAQEKASAHLLRLLPGSFYGRGLEDRTLLLREGGGTMRSEQAVELGLEWLAAHQAPTGMWSNDAFQAAGKCNCGDPGQPFDVAGTAFGVLPFLGADQTHLRGRYAKTVQKGLSFLFSKQKPGGNFSDNMYENALATIAVCESYGLSRDAHLRTPAQAAVNFIVRAQNGEGGWGYSPGAKGDTSVTGWQFAALKAAVFASLTVPKDTFKKLSGFLDMMADPSGLGYGYNTTVATRSTTAVGLLCREFLGWGPGQPGLTRGLDQLLLPENIPTKDNLSIYFIFYATQAMHHVGGKTWETWNSRVRDLLVDLQDQGTDPEHAHQKGSWSPKGDPYAVQGGRLMFTSLALITLETYYYHIPLYGYGAAVLFD